MEMVLCSGGRQTIRAGYWWTEGSMKVDEINTELFTHFYCAFAVLDPKTFEAVVPESRLEDVSNFSKTIKQKARDATTLLSIGSSNGEDADIFSNMVITKPRRQNFIESSLTLARAHGFNGLDLHWKFPSSDMDVINLGLLLQEWHDSIANELLVATVFYSPILKKPNIIYPIYEMNTYLDWINIQAYDFYPLLSTTSAKCTAPAHAYLNKTEPDFCGYIGIKKWCNEHNFPADKVVFGIPFHGWSWILEDDEKRDLFSPAKAGDSVPYGKIHEQIPEFADSSKYDDGFITTYVSKSKLWIAYDDERSIEEKIVRARKDVKYLLRGYYVWELSGDDSRYTLATAARDAWR